MRVRDVELSNRGGTLTVKDAPFGLFQRDVPALTGRNWFRLGLITLANHVYDNRAFDRSTISETQTVCRGGWRARKYTR